MSRTGTRLLISWRPVTQSSRLLAKKFVYNFVCFGSTIVILNGCKIIILKMTTEYVIEIRGTCWWIKYNIRDTCLSIHFMNNKTVKSIIKHGDEFTYTAGCKYHGFNSNMLQEAIRNWQNNPILSKDNLEALIRQLN